MLTRPAAGPAARSAAWSVNETLMGAMAGSCRKPCPSTSSMGVQLPPGRAVHVAITCHRHQIQHMDLQRQNSHGQTHVITALLRQQQDLLVVEVLLHLEPCCARIFVVYKQLAGLAITTGDAGCSGAIQKIYI